MSRAASSLFGAGDLDEVSIYNRALSAATIADHYSGNGGAASAAPTATFTASPSTAASGQTVTYDASQSVDPDGTIAKYEWDLDGNGTYETDTGTTATVTKSYPSSRSVDVRLRVTDNSGANASTTRTVTITNRAPTASFTFTPSPVVIGQPVTFNGTASSDPDGTIAKYEWDLDGNGTFETDTGTTATTTHTYTSAAATSVTMRVTDNEGATDTQTHTLDVRQPGADRLVHGHAGLGADRPGDRLRRHGVERSGRHDRQVRVGPRRQRHVRDRHGHDEDHEPHVHERRAASTSRLRVTDDKGATATQTKTVTVTNRAPTASFTVTPNPAATRQNVTLNAAGSTDPDGTIAHYEWDLDNNGTYETDGGTTATRTATFATVGTVTVGLRVTDNNGATATTTRTLTVTSAYRAAVLATAGISDYWRLDDTGTTAADANGANNTGTYVNAPVTATGLLAGETNAARTFNGTTQYVDLSPTPFGTPAQLSAEAWVRTTATKGAGGYHFLITDSSSDFDNGFSLVIDSANRAMFSVARTTGFTVTRGQATSSVTLAPNTTHHVVGTYDGTTVRIYVDGVQVGTASFTVPDQLVGFARSASRAPGELVELDVLPAGNPGRGRAVHAGAARGHGARALQLRQAVGRKRAPRPPVGRA